VYFFLSTPCDLVLHALLRHVSVGEQKANHWEGLECRNPLAVRAAAEPSSITRVREVLDGFAARDRTGETLTAVAALPCPRAAQWADFPDWIHADLLAAYKTKKHRAAVQPSSAGGGDGSRQKEYCRRYAPPLPGKPFATNLPVIHAILENTDTRAIYLFPTKALGRINWRKFTT